MTGLNAVIFDLDDTLYPERAFALSGFAAVAEAYSDVFAEPIEAAARMRHLFDAEHRGRVFNHMLAEQGLEEDPALVARMIQTYRTHRADISLLPDADAALTRLAEHYKLGLITDGPAVMQQNKINALKLALRLGEIIVTAELGDGFGKPHPRAFELMAARFDVDPARCVYVADNPRKDFLAPRALGWITIQIMRAEGIYRHEPPPPGGVADHVIDTLDSLDSLLS